MLTFFLRENTLSERNHLEITGLSITAKPMFPARCNIVNGICKMKALKIVCPNIGANKTPVIKSKTIVAKNENITKFVIDDLNFLKYKYEATPTSPYVIDTVQVQDPKCVIRSYKNILRKPNINPKIAPYLRPMGIIEAITGSTFGALKGISLKSIHPIKTNKILNLFFILIENLTYNHSFPNQIPLICDGTS